MVELFACATAVAAVVYGTTQTERSSTLRQNPAHERPLLKSGGTPNSATPPYAERLAAFYEVWHKKEPTGGYDAKAAEYRASGQRSTAGGNGRFRLRRARQFQIGRN